MELQLSVIDPAVDDRTDMLVDADPAAPVGSLAAEIARRLGRAGDPAGPPGLHVNGFRIDPEVSLDASPLRDGSLVSLAAPGGCPPPEAQGTVEVRVVGGPDAGGVYRLGPGVAVIGSGPEAWIRLADPTLAQSAVEVEVALDGTVTAKPGAGGTMTMDGKPLVARSPWRRRSVIAAGQSLLELQHPVFPDAALKPSEDGTGLDYNRPPRITPPPRPTQFTLPSKPKQGEARPLPWVMAGVPLVGSVAMATMMHESSFLFMAVLSPMTMVANYFNDRKHGKKSFRQSLADYEKQKDSIERQARKAAAAETGSRREGAPDPAEVLVIATGPSGRLWERRRADGDYALLRVGTGHQRSEVEVSDPMQEEHKRTAPRDLPDVPVAVPIPVHGVLGIAGRGELPRSVGRWLVAQAAVLHSPADLQVCVLTDPSGRDSWSWVRWLPHARARDGQSALALIGTDADSVARRISELLAQVTARQDAAREAGLAANQRWGGPTTLVVLDGSRRLRALPGLTQILRDGPKVGIHLICLDADRRLLPEECLALVEEDYYGLLQVSMAGQEPVTGVRPDRVTPQWCERVARAIAPIRDISGDDGAALPDACRLLDVIDLEPPTAQGIVGRWAAGGRSTSAVVGASFDGAFAIDLVRDGPHGLVAGTTGSGKSELLQTIVASLAVANRPDAMTFVLVDYKGGSAFKDCNRLPHTVGMVTDLDTHLVERALESLGAELRRREHILAAAGTKDLEDYIVAMRTNPSLAPMPRLLIVIDEFASMARELPDFVSGLVNVAQRGRSLGIHLILATQRPSGVVSPEIRANTNLRIALRVTDAAESGDVIDAPDAGHIAKSTPGRAYVRLGATSLLPFQSGRVGGRRPGQVATKAPVPFTATVGWEDLGRPAPERPAGARTNDDDLLTDLAVLVDSIIEANQQLAIPPQHSPWLPALTESMTLDDLEPPRRLSPDGLLPAPYAVDDLPGQQARRTTAIELPTFGHLMIAGAPRSGRSQALRTIAGSLGRANSPADLHMYGLDCGNGALLALTALPHCGAVVRANEGDRAIRLIENLSAEVQRRMSKLGEHGFTDINEQRLGVPEGERLPHIVLFLDRWEGFMPSLGELNAGALTDAVYQLMREGASVGIHVVLTGDRTVLLGRISSLTENKMAFQLSDQSDLSMIGLNPRKVPAKVPPGRGFRAQGGVETHVALLSEDPSGQAQSAALATIGEWANSRWADVPRARRPFRVDVLPARITFEEAWALRDTSDAAVGTALWAMAAVGGDQLLAMGPDLASAAPAFIIAGPPRSGRSTALLTVTRSLLSVGTQVVLAAPRRQSPLRRLKNAPGVVGYFTGEEISEDEMREALDRVEGPAVVLVDDAEILRQCDAGDVLTSVVRRSYGKQIGVVIAGDADDMCGGFSGWQVEMKKARSGLLLSPQNMSDADLIGVRLQRAAIGNAVQPGRGLLHLGDGEVRTVQVPLTAL
ncbi:FtsK/SpoIIIE domain-containing protein [Streptantibioticus silvisoli]|uniref:FtsK/SpoIIIE domain-containing protein n=1 Tax=Streptantibioticus silvisoli TaxID=2705255 RepID=A0ABT6W757_9ACTN|nr:FtsK/SpoIIIE domain-containing protein [Streptantibioticus silvisoli]MDI5966569.1 FtsK/SpoIIIE domain-containing protein [Streptantibioticus silvisoli]